MLLALAGCYHAPAELTSLDAPAIVDDTPRGCEGMVEEVLRRARPLLAADEAVARAERERGGAVGELEARLRTDVLRPEDARVGLRWRPPIGRGGLAAASEAGARLSRAEAEAASAELAARVRADHARVRFARREVALAEGRLALAKERGEATSRRAAAGMASLLLQSREDLRERGAEGELVELRASLTAAEARLAAWGAGTANDEACEAGEPREPERHPAVVAALEGIRRTHARGDAEASEGYPWPWLEVSYDRQPADVDRILLSLGVPLTGPDGAPAALVEAEVRAAQARAVRIRDAVRREIAAATATLKAAAEARAEWGSSDETATRAAAVVEKARAAGVGNDEALNLRATLLDHRERGLRAERRLEEARIEARRAWGRP